VISLLQRIVDSFVCWVLTGIVTAVNFLVAGLAAIVSGLLAVMPPMPDLPTTPDWIVQGYAWGAYWFPVGFLVTLLAMYYGFWAAWFVISIPLRWGKVVRE